MPAAFPSSPPVIPTAPLTAEMRDALRAIVGEKGLIEDEHDKQPFVTDWRGLLVGSAGAVIRPGSTEEVSSVVRLCHEQGVAIVPQGGNTGLMGGATPWPAHTGIVLSLGRMNRILDVDPVGYSMTVEAGCVLQTLQETASEHDRFLPLSLGAQGSCMIGGNLSTNAGGVQVLRYGNARNLVLGLEVVLPNGEVWDGLRAQSVPDLAIRQHDFEPQHEIAGIAIAQHLHAAGVGREIAADHAGALGAEAERQEAVVLACGLLKRL